MEDDLARSTFDPLQVALWDAVNEYAESCGGDTGPATIGGRRMKAVSEVSRAVCDLIDRDKEADGLNLARGLRNVLIAFTVIAAVVVLIASLR